MYKRHNVWLTYLSSTTRHLTNSGLLVQFIFLSVNFQVAWGETHIDQIYVCLTGRCLIELIKTLVNFAESKLSWSESLKGKTMFAGLKWKSFKWVLAMKLYPFCKVWVNKKIQYLSNLFHFIWDTKLRVVLMTTLY